MPFNTQKDGKDVVAYLKEEVDSMVAQAVIDETVALKLTNKQLKEEKTALAEKEREATEVATKAELEKAKADKDSEKVAQLLEQQKADLQAQIASRDIAIKSEKTSAFLRENVNAIGLGGQLNNDLEVLLKSRIELDYSLDSGGVIAKDKLTGAEITDLKKYVTDSGNYDLYITAGGASGAGVSGQGTAGAGTANPFKKGEHFNLTEQAKMLRTDPDLAKRLRSQI